MSQIFEYASRNKLRFASTKGLLSSEDLWSLSLPQLDTIAKAINKDLKNAAEESFIAEKSQKDTNLEVSLEIVKYVISHKLAQQDAATKRAETLAQKEQLANIIAMKKSEALMSKPIEELEAMLKG
jgi:hypothetical protein